MYYSSVRTTPACRPCTWCNLVGCAVEFASKDEPWCGLTRKFVKISVYGKRLQHYPVVVRVRGCLYPCLMCYTCGPLKKNVASKRRNARHGSATTIGCLRCAGIYPRLIGTPRVVLVGCSAPRAESRLVFSLICKSYFAREWKIEISRVRRVELTYTANHSFDKMKNHHQNDDGRMVYEIDLYLISMNSRLTRSAVRLLRF